MVRQTRGHGPGAGMVERGEASYEEIRRAMVWNRLVPARHPDVIIHPESAEGVVSAVRLARSRGARIALRSGGHSWCASPLRDAGMLIDLSGLRTCVVDPASSTATVGPGVTGRELAGELARHGLAFPAGHCGSVALGGYLLSGGLGWNSGVRGPACADVEAVDVVTADAELLTCGAAEHPDLFWAARGAGPGFFAAVTAFRLRLHPHPGAITGITWSFPIAEVAEVARWALTAADGLSPRVELSFVLGAADPGATPRRPVVTVGATAFAGSRREAGDLLEPLASCPFGDRAVLRRRQEPMTFEALYDASAAAWPPEHRYAADTLWSDADHLTLLARLAEAVETAPSGRSLVLVPVSPAADTGQDMAFAVLGRSYAVSYAVWDDPREDAANTAWLHRTMSAVEPLITGHYVAETDLTAAPSRARRCFRPEAWRRLEELAARHDPGNVFHSYLSPDEARPATPG
ncbi:FAD-binding oxidoreductase [Streptomyces sp. NPDC048664]|uniref:FAD-binding oxidoreductase n=1 Tax=Streptomyces sp. NPDC048664 TaxID=3154505 RepID=UPI0034338F61